MTFAFSPRTTAALVGVNPDLIRVVNHAITISLVEFQVLQGRRSAADQLKAWQTGHSRLNGIPVGQTVNGIAGTGVGKHQSGNAVDAYPYENGQPIMNDWLKFYPVISAMRDAAIAENVKVRWGGCWDRSLNDLPAGPLNMELEHNAYLKREAARGNHHPLLDAPHLEV